MAKQETGGRPRAMAMMIAVSCCLLGLVAARQDEPSVMFAHRHGGGAAGRRDAELRGTGHRVRGDTRNVAGAGRSATPDSDMLPVIRGSRLLEEQERMLQDDGYAPPAGFDETADGGGEEGEEEGGDFLGEEEGGAGAATNGTASSMAEEVESDGDGGALDATGPPWTWPDSNSTAPVDSSGDNDTAVVIGDGTAEGEGETPVDSSSNSTAVTGDATEPPAGSGSSPDGGSPLEEPPAEGGDISTDAGSLGTVSPVEGEEEPPTETGNSTTTVDATEPPVGSGSNSSSSSPDGGFPLVEPAGSSNGTASSSEEGMVPASSGGDGDGAEDGYGGDTAWVEEGDGEGEEEGELGYGGQEPYEGGEGEEGFGYEDDDYEKELEEYEEEAYEEAFYEDDQEYEEELEEYEEYEEEEYYQTDGEEFEEEGSGGDKLFDEQGARSDDEEEDPSVDDNSFVLKVGAGMVAVVALVVGGAVMTRRRRISGLRGEFQGVSHRGLNESDSL